MDLFSILGQDELRGENGVNRAKEQPLIHLTQVQEGPNPYATWA
jgi:hypothetical protein